MYVNEGWKARKHQRMRVKKNTIFHDKRGFFSPPFNCFTHIHKTVLCSNESLSIETQASANFLLLQLFDRICPQWLSVFLLLLHNSGVFVRLHSCYRPAVPLPRQSSGRAPQVQEGVGQRHEMHRRLCRNQPRQCCILSSICFAVVATKIQPWIKKTPVIN